VLRRIIGPKRNEVRSGEDQMVFGCELDNWVSIPGRGTDISTLPSILPFLHSFSFLRV
jgi:hypothetical protein